MNEKRLNKPFYPLYNLHVFLKNERDLVEVSFTGNSNANINAKCFKVKDIMISYPQDSNFYRFQGKQLMAIDYGEKITGIASFIPGNDPFPLMGDRIVFRSKPQLTKSIILQAEELGAEALILGKPLLTDGRLSTMTKKVLAFGRFLTDQSGLPVFLQDETLSTEAAKDRMKNSPEFNFKVDLKKIDNLSAVIILEDFLKNNENDKLE